MSKQTRNAAGLGVRVQKGAISGFLPVLLSTHLTRPRSFFFFFFSFVAAI